MDRSGVLTVIERLPAASQLIVVNYHRIGGRNETDFDPGVFSADVDALDAQISALKRRYAIVDEAEALDIVGGARPRRGKAILLTFDDGYIDNLTLAAPVLRSNGIKALFFLVTDFLANPNQIPRWDRIAWLVRRCNGRRLVLSKPERLSVLVRDEDLMATIREVLRRYWSAAQKDASTLLAELEACASTGLMQNDERLLMNWDDACQLRDLGMDLGLHTHTHAMLSQLSVEDQTKELETCSRLMKERLGLRARSLAYPFGTPQSFSLETKRLAKEVAYEAAFSFYGGTNIAGQIDQFDVRRVAFAEDAGATRARAAVALLAATRSFWL
jgi:peptidoglycan/xylan/chitin deacetylase (PgdA/CDA1 family)